MQAFERQNRKILQTKGELSAERKERGDALAASFHKLNSGTINLAEALDEDLPVLPEESKFTFTNSYFFNKCLTLFIKRNFKFVFTKHNTLGKLKCQKIVPNKYVTVKF